MIDPRARRRPLRLRSLAGLHEDEARGTPDVSAVELEGARCLGAIVVVSEGRTYVEILDDDKGPTCVAFLRRAIARFATQGITVQRVMTDNGTGYRSKVHAAAITQLGIKHLRTRPYRPAPTAKQDAWKTSTEGLIALERFDVSIAVLAVVATVLTVLSLGAARWAARLPVRMDLARALHSE